MSKTDDFIALDRKYGAHNYHPLPVVLSRAEGAWVWDVEGKRYLDCLSAYSAVNQGHRHPKIMAALVEQAARLDLTSRAFHNDVMGRFLEKLCAYTGFEAALPMNTGAEAVETGIKLARRWGYERQGIPAGEAQIVVCEENFHGRTTTIVGFSTDPEARDGYGPATPGFVIIPYDDPRALEAAIHERTAAFLVEPIQGAAGVRLARGHQGQGHAQANNARQAGQRLDQALVDGDDARTSRAPGVGPLQDGVDSADLHLDAVVRPRDHGHGREGGAAQTVAPPSRPWP